MDVQVNPAIRELFPGEEGRKWCSLMKYAEFPYFTGIWLDEFGEVSSEGLQQEALSIYLHPQEMKKLATLMLPKRRREWLGGRLAAKFACQLALGEIEGALRIPWPEYVVDNLPSGQPALSLNKEIGSTLPFLSISHSNGLAVAMTSLHKPCGIDVQHISSRILRVLERFCSAQEKSIIEESTINEDVVGLNLLWAAKEAVRKVYGCSSPPGFQKIVLQSIRSYPAGKIGMLFSVTSGKEMHSDMETFMVGTTVMEGYALAFTIRGAGYS